MVKLPTTVATDVEGVEQRTQLLHDLGVLIALWSQLEIYVEIAICRITKINPLHNSIMLGALQFKAKISILYSLLKLNGQTETISKMKAATGYAKRNILMHSAFASEDDFSKFVFFYRSVDDAYKVKGHTYTAEEFHAHVYKFRDLANLALTDLKLSESDLNEYGHTAQFDGIGK